jgi:hypothetical protein
MFDDVGQLRDRSASVVLAREVCSKLAMNYTGGGVIKHTAFVLSHRATSIEDEALRINEINPLACLSLGEALESEEAHELHSDTNTGRSSTKEKDAMISQGAARCTARKLGRVHEPGEYNGTGALDVIVEHSVQTVTFSKGFQVVECVI